MIVLSPYPLLQSLALFIAKNITFEVRVALLHRLQLVAVVVDKLRRHVSYAYADQ